MILLTNNKVVFFFILLISMSISKLNAQTSPPDTLKKVSADTLKQPENDSDGLEEQVKYSAEDSTVALPQEGKALLYGKAKVDYGSTNIQAEYIEIDYSKNLIMAYGKKDSTGKPIGNPVFKDGDETMEADKIMYNLKTKKGKIFNALTKQGELLVIGKEIKKDSLNNVYFKDMRCLPCQEADARTAFKATKAKAIPDDKIVTGPMFLEIGNVPTPLGLPFGYFPNTKKQVNGILMPTFGTSAQFGTNLRNGGYYLGINDKTDMVILGDIYANGSWLLNTKNSYKQLYKCAGLVDIKYSTLIYGDKDLPSSYSKQKTYDIIWQHNQDNKSDPSVRFSANVHYVKNQRFNRFNSINTGQFLTNTFISNINFTKTYKFGSVSVNGMHSENTISKRVDITFPSLTFNVNRFFPFKRPNAVKQNVFDKVGISYILEAQNKLSGIEDTTLFKGNVLDSMNYGVRHTLPISTNFNIFKFITATPGVNLSSVMYTKSLQKEYYTTPEVVKDTLRNIAHIRNATRRDFIAAYDANFSTAFNTKVYFDYAFRKGKVTKIRHMLIPTLTYNYRPDFGAPKYGINKSVQYDTLGHRQNYSALQNAIFPAPAAGKINGLSLNLNNTLDAKLKQKTDTGITERKVTLIQGLGLNGSYNFAADSFRMSEVAVTLRTVLFKYFDITAGSNFNPYVYDKIGHRVKNEYLYDQGGRMARFTSGRVAINTSIGSNMIEALKKTRQPNDQTNGAERGAQNDLDDEKPLPWNLRVSYNLNLTNANDTKVLTTQLLNFSGDVMPTKYWKIGITSGFDFNHKSLSYTSINIYRDLKCWEARIDWVPFGVNKSYNLTLNLKTAMLSDFKIPKRSLPRIDQY